MSISESGADLDMNGYVVRVDMAAGGNLWSDDLNARKVPGGGSTTYAGLSAGSHTLDLFDVWGNCSVEGGSSRNIDVPGGGTAQVEFAVSCAQELPAEIDIAGNWAGRFTITDIPGDASLELEQSGDEVSGSFELAVDGQARLIAGPISGRVSGRRVTLYTDYPGDVQTNPGRIYWRLNADAAGAAMNGSHEWDGSDVGSTQLEKQ